MKKGCLKALSAITVMICLLTGLMPGVAENLTTHTLGETGVQVTLPADMYVFTKENAELNPHLSKFGLTPQQLLAWMAENGMNLVAFDQYGALELNISVMDSAVNNMRDLSESTMKLLSDSMITTYQAQGAEAIQRNSYLSDQHTYLVYELKLTQDGSPLYSLVYLTIAEGKSVLFKLTSYVSLLTLKDELLLREIADSLLVGNSTATFITALTPSRVYTDAPGKISFTIPAGWPSVPPPAIKNHESALFKSEIKPEANIYLIILDAPLAVLDTPRTLDTELFTVSSGFSEKMVEASISGFLSSGNEIKTIEVVTYGDYHFYKIDCVNTKAEQDLAAILSTTHLMRVHKGRLYQFILLGQFSEALLADVDRMMESVRFSE